MGASGTAIEACIKQIVVVRDVAGEAEQPEQLSTRSRAIQQPAGSWQPRHSGGIASKTTAGIFESEYEAGKITHRWYK
jgi:hypothetical protein